MKYTLRQVFTDTKNCWGNQNREHYLGVNAEDVALDFVHGVETIGHGAQMEPFEHHLILGKSSWNKANE